LKIKEDGHPLGLGRRPNVSVGKRKRKKVTQNRKENQKVLCPVFGGDAPDILVVKGATL